MVFYAAKAFLSTTVARWVEEEGLGLDVCTGGELAVALRAGFPGERMLLHGNNKSSAELAAALDAGVGRVVVDSLQEVERLSALCVARGVTQRVLVRVTVGVEAHTHEFIATAHEDQKFGFSLAGGEALDGRPPRCRPRPGLELVGLHSHIGSQIFDAGGFEVAAHRVVGLLAEVRDELGAELRRAQPRRRAGHRLHQRRRPGRRARDGALAGRHRRAGVPGGRPAAAVAGHRAGPRHRRARDGHRLRGRHGEGGRGPAHLRLGRRRHERQHPHRALRRRLHGDPRVPARRTRRRCWPGSSASTARAATSWSRTPGCRRTSGPATCSPSPRPGRTAGRWRRRTTTCRDPRWWPSREAGSRVLLRRETIDDLITLDAGDRPAGRRLTMRRVSGSVSWGPAWSVMRSAPGWSSWATTS